MDEQNNQNIQLPKDILEAVGQAENRTSASAPFKRGQAVRTMSLLPRLSQHNQHLLKKGYSHNQMKRAALPKQS